MAKRKKVKKIDGIENAGKALGLAVACDFAAMVARRIVEIGPELTPDVIAKVGTALGMRLRFVCEDVYGAAKPKEPEGT